MSRPIYGSENFATTMNVAGNINNSQTTGIVLSSTTGLDANGGILGFDWASTIDTTTYEEIEYTSYDGSNQLTGVTRGVNGTTARSHNNGCVIACVVTKAHINRLSDKLRSVDPILVQDVNGNEIIKTSYVASAVNEVTVTNAATAGQPIIEATGDDSTISPIYRGKSAFNTHTGEYDNGNSGTAQTISGKNGDRQLSTLTGNVTYTFSNFTKGQSIILRIVEDGTGGRTVTLPTVKWPGGTVGTFTTTANAINLLVIYYDGTNYLVQLAAGFA